MATYDQMIIDDHDLANRYFDNNHLDDLVDDQYLYAKPSINNRQEFHSKPLINKDDDTTPLFGRRVYLESPSLDNKEEEDMYRFVPSRLSEHASTVIGKSIPAPSGETLIDSLDFELDLFGTTNARHAIPYRTNTQVLQASKPPAPLTQLSDHTVQSPMTNMRRADPRQDPLLGPLLAELDAMSAQQYRLPQAPSSPPPVHRRNSVPYEPHLTRPPGQSQSNHALITTANRTVTDALLEAELYDSLDPRDEQIPPIQQHQSTPYSAPNLNSRNNPRQKLPTRSSNMNSTDIFMPSSYDTGPAPFLSHFGPDDQLFQQPLLNAMGQNYVPNPRQPHPPQRQQQEYEQQDTTFDNSYSRISPPHRTAYAPPHQHPNNHEQQHQHPNDRKTHHLQQPTPPPPPSNRQTPHNNHNNDPFSEYHDMYAPPHPSQFQRSQPPPPPTQQYPPPFQQQRMLPPPQQQSQRNPPPPPPQQYYEEQTPRNTYPSNNQEMFFTDHNDDLLEPMSYRQQQQQQPHPPSQPPPMASHRGGDQQQEQDSKRQAIWNDLQRTNNKVQEKNAKKRESANRREQHLKGNYGSNNNAWNNNNGSQQSSAQSKTGGHAPAHRPPPGSKTNYIDGNIDMIKNKENFYHRYPAKKYENLYSKRKDLAGVGDQKNGQNQDNHLDFDHTQSSTLMNNPVATYADSQHRASLPVTINLNPGANSESGNLPATVTIPLESHVNRVGDKISVNIDLRLVDLQNLKTQQQQRQQRNNDHPDWSGLDPLDRHIRKLEQSIDQSLPPTHSPNQRSPILSNQGVSTSMGRYGKSTTGAGRGGGYDPPNYSNDYYNYSEKGKEEDSYLAKMNHVKKGPHFKPYTGRDYDQFKKNYGFGTGNLGFDFDNPHFKEKNDKINKTKEYAQQIELRNKKKLSEAPRRTLSDTRIPTEASKTQRALEYARVSTRHKPPSGTSTRSTPPDMNEAAATPGRRPTEVLHRPPPAQKHPTKLAHNDDNELVDRLAMRHERDKAQVHGILNPSQKRREQLFDDDDRHVSDIERLAQDRANQRRLSPPRQLPPTGPSNAGNTRRPLRFDKPLVPDESSYPPQQQQEQEQQQSHHPIPQQRRSHGEQQHQDTNSNVDELANRHNDEKMLMEAIRQELSERPLGDDEELIVVEQ